MEYAPEQGGVLQKLKVTWDLMNNPSQPHLAPMSPLGHPSTYLHGVHDASREDSSIFIIFLSIDWDGHSSS